MLRSGYFDAVEAKRRAEKHLDFCVQNDRGAIKAAQERGEDVIEISLSLTITVPASTFLTSDLETAIENTSFRARTQIEAQLMLKLKEQHHRLGQMTEKFQRNLECLYKMQEWDDQRQRTIPTETHNAEEAMRFLEENISIELEIRKEVQTMDKWLCEGIKNLQK